MKKMMTIVGILLISFTGRCFECAPITLYKNLPNPIPELGTEFQNSFEQAVPIALAYDCRGENIKNHVCVYLDPKLENAKFEGVVQGFNRDTGETPIVVIQPMNLYDVGPNYKSITNSLFSFLNLGSLSISLLSQEERKATKLQFDLDHSTSMARLQYRISRIDSQSVTDLVRTDGGLFFTCIKK